MKSKSAAKTPNQSRGQPTGHQPVIQALALLEHLRLLGLRQSQGGLDALRAQLLVMLWRFPQLSIAEICARYYLDPGAARRALASLREGGYINSPKADVRLSLTKRRWRLSARARKIIPALLRAEEGLIRAMSALGSGFSAHWCYDMQNLNSALRQRLAQAGKTKNPAAASASRRSGTEASEGGNRK